MSNLLEKLEHEALSLSRQERAFLMVLDSLKIQGQSHFPPKFLD